jgi:TIR domain-containing protein
MEYQQDVFISHAGRDKEEYIQPLTDAFVEKGITFWLDNIEIGWGDSVTRKIDDGLARSRFVLLCLSRAFLRRRWPESELGAALSVQNDSGVKRVLPLILNDKDAVLARFPLLADLSFRDFSIGPAAIAEEISTLTGRPIQTPGELRIIVESVHTGKICSITASQRVSVGWLVDRAQKGMGVSDLADTGAYEPFYVRWVLVDTRAEAAWRKLPRSTQRRLHALVAKGEPVKSRKDLIFSFSDRDRLGQIGIGNGAVFHMYAIEDEVRPLPAEG